MAGSALFDVRCWPPISIVTGKKRIGCQYFAGKFIFEVFIIPGNHGWNK
jgi:hypothetical protein